MFENDDDDSGFWSNVPDSRFDRFTSKRKARTDARRPAGRPSGSRQHDTGSLPVVTVTDRVRAASDHVDPLLRRAGALAVVIALLVPVAMSLRSGGRSTSLRPNDSTLAEGAVATDGEAGTVDAADATSSSGDGATATATAAAIDPNDLPPAIPVVTATQPAASTQRATTAAPAATQPKRVEAVAQTQTVCAKKYTVVSGDAWLVIAKKVSVSVKDLLVVNNASTSTALFPKQQICLPANASAPTTAKPTPTTVKAKPTTTTVKPATTVKVTTTTAKPVVPQKAYTKAQVIQIIRDVWPDNLEDEAIRIATRESNLVPTVKNYCCYGLFQIYWNVHKGWLAQIGVTSASQLWDPRVNAYAALVLYTRAGSFAPWNP